MAPWNGPRHRTWASDTVVLGVVFFVVLTYTVVTSWVSGQQPPSYLQALLGASSAALFAAVGSDKSKREREIADEQLIARLRAAEISAVANRADAKADSLVDFARAEHPPGPPATGGGG